MPTMLLVLIAVGLNPAASKFVADHPRSATIRAADGHIAHASGFLAETGLRDPAQAAGAFLSRYGDAFGVAGQLLEVQSAPAAGTAGAVRFSRTLDGLPVFGADLVVGVDARARAFVVNGGQTVPRVSGRHLIGEAAAARATIASLGGDVQAMAPATVLKGWRPVPGATRAVYRVDLIAQRPAGDWRVYVDGETGAVLFREDLRYRASAQGTAFEVSPTETATGPCALSGSGGLSFCANPSNLTFPNLSTGLDLSGSQTTVYNCGGADAPASAASFPGPCTPVSATGGTFNALPDQTYQSTKDDFAAGMAYYHLDKHVSFFKSLDSNLPPSSGTPTGSSRALRGSLPALVNAWQAGVPLENAFFSGGLDAMVFGQGANTDYAYDATVMYHEFTHGAVFAWGDYHLNIDALGGLDEPGALNEGTADAMAVSETGRSTIGGFIGSTSTPAVPFLRDLNDPDVSRTCQGDGTVVTQFGATSVNGFDGEVHDDGEVWNGFYWEVFDGLRTAGVKGCGGACQAGPAIQYKTMQLSGGTSPTFSSYWQTFKAAASAMFPSQPSVAAYVDCVARRRRLDQCDRTVPLYAGERKLEFIRLRYSPFQVALQTTGPAQFDACSAQGTSTTIHVRKDLPVQITAIDPVTLNATMIDDGSASLAQRCSAGMSTFTLSSAGTWYLLLDSPDALNGGSPGFDIYRFDAAVTAMAARPAASAPISCTPPFPLAIAADSSSLPPRGRLVLRGTGGSATGYSWALATNRSGGSIGPSSGVYTPGATGGVIDVVQLTDSVGESTTGSFSVTAGVSVTPPAASLAPGEHLALTATGGSGTGFTWAVTANASGGKIDASGNYTAGATGSVADVVTATDSLGNTATSTVTVTAATAGGGGCSTGGTANASLMLVAAACLLRRRGMRRRASR